MDISDPENIKFFAEETHRMKKSGSIHNDRKRSVIATDFLK